MKWLYESQINGSIVLNLLLGMVSELQWLTIRNLKIKCLQFFFFEKCEECADQNFVTAQLVKKLSPSFSAEPHGSCLPGRSENIIKFCYQRWICPKTRVLLNQWLLSGPHD